MRFDDDGLLALIAAPSPDTLRRLRGVLLEAGLVPDAEVWATLDHFFQFLNELAANATSRQYSHFASLLDIGAVGSVAVQNLLSADDGEPGGPQIWKRLLAGGLSEGLMVLAARQYVKAWEGEMAAVYRAAAWNLTQHLWRISSQMRPEMPAGDRRHLLERLLAPAGDESLPGTARAALIARLYQVVLLVQISNLQER